MEPTIITSIIGVIVFTLIMRYVYNTANGKRKVQEAKKVAYIDWVNKYGSKVKIGIIIISVLYGIGMLVQVISLLNE